MFEIILFWLFLGLVAFVAGIYSRVAGMSFGLVLVVGLYSLKSLMPVNDITTVLPIVLATSLAACVPINLLYLIQAATSKRIDIDFVSKTATVVTLVAIISAQLVGILPVIYVQVLFLIMMSVYCVYYLMPTELLGWIKIKLQANIISKARLILLGVLPVVSGTEGKEINSLFFSENVKSNLSSGSYSTVAFFVSFSACIGFVFPAFPIENVLFYQETDIKSLDFNLANVRIGYIDVPIALYLSFIGFLGLFFVRDHKNEVDSVLMEKVFSFFLLGVLIKDYFLLLL